MPVNPTNKDAKERLKTEQKISQEQSKQKKFAEGFRNIQNEIKDSLHDMTLSQQTFFRTQVGTRDIEEQIHKQIKLSKEYQRIRNALGSPIARAYAMTVDPDHTGGGYYTFDKIKRKQ